MAKSLPRKRVKTIFLGHKRIDIYREPSTYPPPDLNPEELDGYYLPYDNGDAEIYVAKTLNQAVARETYLHELIEAVNHTLDLDMKHTQIQALAFSLQPFLGLNCPK